MGHSPPLEQAPIARDPFRFSTQDDLHFLQVSPPIALAPGQASAVNVAGYCENEWSYIPKSRTLTRSEL